MKTRFSYPLLFLLPSLMVAAIAAIIFVALSAGVLWLFVFGDNSWPEATNAVVMSLATLVATIVLAALMYACYSRGKHLESAGGLSFWHAAAAMAITALISALVFNHQRHVGNIGPKEDVIVCADFCTARKFNSFKFPRDGTCRCYDSSGQEALNVSIYRAQSE